MSAREIEKRANPLARLATIMGAGAIGGGAIGAMNAPSDYAPEGFVRGMRQGLMAGAGAGLGGLAGSAAGKGLAHAGNRLVPRHIRLDPSAKPLLLSPRVLGGVGNVAGMVGGGTAAAVADTHRNVGLAPWETGKLPLLERLDATLRRRTPPPDFRKTSSEALKSMGLVSDRDAQKATQKAKASEGMHAGLAGLAGAGAGAAGGAGLAALVARAGERMRALRGGAVAGGVAGLLGGSLAGARRGYALGRDSNAPSDTWLERRFSSLNPV